MKNYKPILSLIAFLTLSNLLIAQNVEVLYRAVRPPEYEAESFSFIASEADTSRLQLVAILRATGVGKNADLEMVFNKLREKAQTLGANAFKLRQFSRIDDVPKSILTLEVYFVSDSAMKRIASNYPKNTVYIIGCTEKSDKTYAFKLDNLKKEIKGGTFYRHQNKEGQEVKINKGGFTGATVWVKWKENKPATFLTLSGLGLSDAPIPPGQMGASINTGRIYYLDENYGYLLLNLLVQSE